MRSLPYLSFILAVLAPLQTQAVTCYLTLVKDTCWTSFDVQVEISDANNGKVLGKLVSYEGKAWERQKFECTPGQTIALNAQFSPEFWVGDEQKIFPGQRYWKLPDNINKGDTGWNVTVCYPKYFANVPTPPHATADCHCELDKIPKIAPE